MMSNENSGVAPRDRGGRPSGYTEEIAATICEAIAEGSSLSTACKGEGMPSVRTALRWLDRHNEFARMYAHAREVRADAWGEQILDIADDTSEDWVDRQKADGTTERVLDHEHVTRSKLRVDARKWLMSKAAPRKYGDKLDLNYSGSVQVASGPDLSHLSDDELAVMRLLLEKAETPKEAEQET